MPKFNPHPYQTEAIDFVLDRLYVRGGHGPHGAGVFADPGLGKTSITLSVIQALKDLDERPRVLLIAPRRVCRLVWPAEIEKWGFDLSAVVVAGTPKQRVAKLQELHDIYLLTPDLVPWLKTAINFTPEAFNMLVVDESTKFKGWGVKRGKALRTLLGQFDRRLILTGTPSPNGLGDLHAQVYLLDNGAALGKTVTGFRSRFMSQGGFKGREWKFDDGRTTDLYEAIAPLVLRLSAEEHLDMPPKVDNVVRVELPNDIRKTYKQLERDLFMALANGEELTASSAGAVYAMCRGVANGGVYRNDLPGRPAEFVHDAKVEATKDLVEELGGKPVMVAYQFLHDLERLRRVFPNAPAIGGGMKDSEAEKVVAGWNRRETPVLLVQPQAMSHGLNLQAGGNDIIWFGMSDQLEVYEQLNARLWRQGVKGQVRIHHLVAIDTVDEAIYTRLHDKAGAQRSMLDALQDYRRRIMG